MIPVIELCCVSNFSNRLTFFLQFASELSFFSSSLPFRSVHSRKWTCLFAKFRWILISFCFFSIKVSDWSTHRHGKTCKFGGIIRPPWKFGPQQGLHQFVASLKNEQQRRILHHIISFPGFYAAGVISFSVVATSFFLAPWHIRSHLVGIRDEFFHICRHHFTSY